MSRSRVVLLILAAALMATAVLAGCARARPAAAGAASSGVRGRAMVDGGCPVQRAEHPCPDKPVAARITVTWAGTGHQVATVLTDAKGRFEMPLSPGRYVVAATNMSGGLLLSTREIEVTVNQGRYSDITVQFDSGIR